jgi:hypothetical protein
MTSFPSVIYLQCTRIDILRVQDIYWWQQGLYPGGCRVRLGRVVKYAVSMAAHGVWFTSLVTQIVWEMDHGGTGDQ